MPTVTHKSRRILVRAYGRNEAGLPDLPAKLGSARLSRLAHGRASGCSYCFPHGWETRNARWYKVQRSWKRYRAVQYREIDR